MASLFRVRIDVTDAKHRSPVTTRQMALMAKARPDDKRPLAITKGHKAVSGGEQVIRFDVLAYGRHFRDPSGSRQHSDT